MAILATFVHFADSTWAFTIDGINKFNKAAVSDSTIELLIKRGGDARSAGFRRQDGWIVHLTEKRFPDFASGEVSYSN